MTFEARVHALIDGELDPTQERLLRQEAASDPDKIAFLEKMEVICRTALDVPEPSPYAGTRILAAAHVRTQAQHPIRIWAAALTALAMGVVIGLNLGTGEPDPSASAVNTPKTFQVRFVYHGEVREGVSVAGTFTDWKSSPLTLVAQRSDVWVAVATIPAGRHEYALVVDGAWLPDPAAGEWVDDGFGRKNSVLVLN